MPPVPVTFDDRILWSSQATRGDVRPYSWIRVHGDRGAIMDLWGLLDTGADYLMLEATVAQSVGIDLRGCPTVEVIIASGASVWLPKTTIDVTILNKRAKVEAIFGIQGTALVGRTTILKVMDFGIDIDGWLHRVV